MQIAGFFGWSIQYVLSLPFPLFLEIMSKVQMLQLGRARGEIYPAVAAGISGANDIFSAYSEIVSYEYGNSKEATKLAMQRAMKVARRIEKEKQEAQKR